MGALRFFEDKYGDDGAGDPGRRRVAGVLRRHPRRLARADRAHLAGVRGEHRVEQAAHLRRHRAGRAGSGQRPGASGAIGRRPAAHRARRVWSPRSSACWRASARATRSWRSCASSRASRWPPSWPPGRSDGIVVARQDGVEPDALRSLAQAVLRHDGVRARRPGRIARRRQGGAGRGHRRRAERHRGRAGAGVIDRRRWRRVGRVGPGRRPERARDGRGAGRGATAPLGVSRAGTCARRASAGVGRVGPGGGARSGARRIGVAYCDSRRTLASPWGTVERSGDPARDQAAVVGGHRRDRGAHGRGRAAPEPLGRQRSGGPGRAARGGRVAPGPRAPRHHGRDGRRALHHGRGAALVDGGRPQGPGARARSSTARPPWCCCRRGWTGRPGRERASRARAGRGSRSGAGVEMDTGEIAGSGGRLEAAAADSGEEPGARPPRRGIEHRRSPRTAPTARPAATHSGLGRWCRPGGRAGVRLLVRAGVTRTRAGGPARGRAGHVRRVDELDRLATGRPPRDREHAGLSLLRSGAREPDDASRRLRPARKRDLRPGARHPGGRARTSTRSRSTVA